MHKESMLHLHYLSDNLFKQNSHVPIYRSIPPDGHSFSRGWSVGWSVKKDTELTEMDHNEIPSGDSRSNKNTMSHQLTQLTQDIGPGKEPLLTGQLEGPRNKAKVHFPRHNYSHFMGYIFRNHCLIPILLLNVICIGFVLRQYKFGRPAEDKLDPASNHPKMSNESTKIENNKAGCLNTSAIIALNKEKHGHVFPIEINRPAPIRGIEKLKEKETVIVLTLKQDAGSTGQWVTWNLNSTDVIVALLLDGDFPTQEVAHFRTIFTSAQFYKYSPRNCYVMIN